MILEKRTLKLMGAFIDIAIYVEEEQYGVKILDEVVEQLHIYNMRFSANDENSELMQVNNNAGKDKVIVHRELYELISLSKKYSSEDSSFLNIAIGPIIKLWNIGFSDARVPQDSDIKDALELINSNSIILDDNENSVYLEKKGMKIDLGAVAKGYIADLIVDHLKEKGVKSGFINLGGNFLSFGKAYHSEDGCWRVGIQDPKYKRGTFILVLNICDKSVVTSGIYERTFEKNGKRYNHIINPKTGYPVENNIESLTILSDKSVIGEIWTTKLFGKDLYDIMDEIEGNTEIEGIVVTKEGNIYCSSGVAKYL